MRIPTALAIVDCLLEELRIETSITSDLVGVKKYERALVTLAHARTRLDELERAIGKLAGEPHLRVLKGE